ncbi:MAG TPA: acyl-CoA thioesterase [Acidobacteria bacterium]|nr:acyl-CoA thioesterase [Acidobacteriota bacterium]
MESDRFSREELLAAPPAKWSWPLRVRLQDVDAAGVVFFARYLEFFHDALMAYLDEQGFDLPRLLEEGEVLAPVKHAEADYLRPLRFGQRCAVEVLAAKVETTQVTVAYRLRLEDGTIAAVGQSVHVAVDARSFERRELPDGIASALECL